MAQLLEIKSRIRSVDSTLKITKAMKMIASARLARARDRFNKVKPVYKRLEVMTNRLMLLMDDHQKYPLFTNQENDEVLFVVLSTDKGFCGGYNLRLFSFIEEARLKFKGKRIHILPFGDKAKDYYDRYENVVRLKKELIMVWEKDLFNQSRVILKELMEPYLEGRYSKVYLVYNKFESILTQQPMMKLLLPLAPKLDSEGKTREVEYIFEPNKNEIIDTMLEAYLILSINMALIELETGEYGARMSAMDGANRNGEKLTKKLKIQYQRARQEAITRQITEIIGGAETLRRETDE